MKFALASSLLVGAEAAVTLVVTWEDCGDADTHTKITDLQPTSFDIGKLATLVGTGDLDKDVNAATLQMTISSGGTQIASCSGDASADVVCKLPLGLGTTTAKAEKFPIKAGSTSLTTEVEMSALIPATLLTASTTHTVSTSDTGEKLFCMDVVTTPQETFAEQVEATTLFVTWEDCGDADTLSKSTDLQPTSFETGKLATLIGTGDLVKDVNGAISSMTMTSGGVQIASCSGDASVDIVCTLPLGMGTTTAKAIQFPIKAGSFSTTTEVKMSALIPASLLAATTTHSEATTDTGEKLFCTDVVTDPAGPAPPATYVCTDGACVVGSSGLAKEVCEQICDKTAIV